MNQVYSLMQRSIMMRDSFFDDLICSVNEAKCQKCNLNQLQHQSYKKEIDCIWQFEVPWQPFGFITLDCLSEILQPGKSCNLLMWVIYLNITSSNTVWMVYSCCYEITNGKNSFQLMVKMIGMMEYRINLYRP